MNYSEDFARLSSVKVYNVNTVWNTRESLLLAASYYFSERKD